MTYDQLKLGDTASFEKTISESDIYMFAGITGDFNPAHMNRRYAEGTRFGKPIAHGMLVGSMFSTVFAMKLPGEGSIYISQELSFQAPVYIGDTIKATVSLKEKLEKGRVAFQCVATNQHGEVVIAGSAILLPPKA